MGGRGGRGWKPDFVACSARLAGGWVVVSSGTNSYYVRLGEGSDWVKETHYAVKAEWKFTFLWFYDFLFFV